MWGWFFKQPEGLTYWVSQKLRIWSSWDSYTEVHINEESKFTYTAYRELILLLRPAKPTATSPFNLLPLKNKHKKEPITFVCLMTLGFSLGFSLLTWLQTLKMPRSVTVWRWLNMKYRDKEQSSHPAKICSWHNPSQQQLLPQAV